MNLAERVKLAREHAGLSQEGLARRAGCSQQAVAKIEKSRSEQSRYLAAIAAALNVSTEWLLGKSPYGGPGERSAYDLRDRETDGTPSVIVTGLAKLDATGTWRQLDPVSRQALKFDSAALGPGAYAFVVAGSALHPALRDGWVVVCDAEGDPVPGEFVLVTTQDGISAIREFLFERAGTLQMMSITADAARSTITREEIAALHPVTAVIPPSRVPPR